MNQMTHRERVVASLAGHEVDRGAISLWRHFGGIDMTAEGLSDAMIGFQREFDFDFVKFMPTGTYTIIDWGADTVWVHNDRGIRTVRRLPVNSPSDWGKLRPLDTGAGVLGMVNDALTRTVQTVGPDVPVLQTIFSPLTTARKLGERATLAHLRQHPDELSAAMDVIEQVTAKLIADAVDRGADIFYAIQAATADILSKDEFERWEAAYSRRLLAAVPEGTIVLLHSHGDFLWFDELAQFPVTGMNWHDRLAGPTIDAARARTSIGIVGGIDAWKDLRDGTIESVREAAIRALGPTPRGVIVGPDCVIPMDAAPHLVRAARDAVEPSVAASAPGPA
jgi:uroporphyrinogen decarboxylase